MKELSVSSVRNFKLTICEGRVVVRSASRINGLIVVRNGLISAQYHGLLATPIFSGSGNTEEVIWASDVFKTTPKKLSELPDKEKASYKQILSDALMAYAKAFVKAEEDVKRLLYSAITYPSEDSVFCGDERVVLTEWGMEPIGGFKTFGMPYGEYLQNEVLEIKNKINESVISQDEPEEIASESKVVSIDSEISDNVVEEATKGTPGNDPIKKRTNWWLWLLGILIVIGGIIICILVNSCSSPMKTVLDVTPEMNKGDVVLSKDSINYVVGNRLVLMLTDESSTIEDFVVSFRKDFPDDKIYILSNPDSLLRRITLTLPSSERDILEEQLPVKYSQFGLIVVPDAIYKTSSMTNDPDLQVQDKRWYFDECGVFDAWDTTMGDDNIVVAIIDDGFDLGHGELIGRVYKPFNAVNHTNQITPSPGGHGTHVASTAIGNANNGEGIAGIAPKCKFMPIQVGDKNGNMSSSAIIDGVLYAISNGADVVNMSLGMYFGPNVQYMPIFMQNNIRNYYFKQEEQMWNQIFSLARQNNVTFVLAGGNENILIGIDPMSRSNNTIKVSAVGSHRDKANFSNYGDLSTVSAPGVHIYNAVPGNSYTFMDGTSMAAPIVSGGCALLKSLDKTLSTNEIANILRSTGNQSIGSVGPTVNFANALRNTDDEDGTDFSFQPITDECSEVNRRYNELLVELEIIKREHPGCIQRPDTMAIPVNVTPEKLSGRWKSTTSIQNSSNEDVVIYFTFNGTNNGRLDIVEPTGNKFTAPLSIKTSNDIIYINQSSPATSNNSATQYAPYKFVIRPNRHRQAEGKANNKEESLNVFTFNLVRV
jgi:subtilisin family serine protease